MDLLRQRSAEERQSLFLTFGIDSGSKKRKEKLVKKIWAVTEGEKADELATRSGLLVLSLLQRQRAAGAGAGTLLDERRKQRIRRDVLDAFRATMRELAKFKRKNVEHE